MTTGTPSPTPWTAEDASIRAGDGRWITYLDDYAGVDSSANADLIVQAVNAFAPMLEAMKIGLDALHAFHPQYPIPVGVGICEWIPCKQLREAIALAEGREETPHG